MSIYAESDLLPLSALQHLAFCPRQCALIHIERVWVENRFTAEGRAQHEHVHAGESETRGECRRRTAVPLRSLELGLYGVADVVEFHRQGESWAPYPVEHKRGKPKKNDCDRIQLCAQAMCLEEMLDTRIEEGALFYGKRRRREVVRFDTEIRDKTKDTARRLHELIASEYVPPPEYSKKCETCSLKTICLPEVVGGALAYLEKITEEP